MITCLSDFDMLLTYKNKMSLKLIPSISFCFQKRVQDWLGVHNSDSPYSKPHLFINTAVFNLFNS